MMNKISVLIFSKILFIIICKIILYVYICILNKGDVCGYKVGRPACFYMLLCSPGQVTAATAVTTAAAEVAADAGPRIPVSVSTH